MTEKVRYQAKLEENIDQLKQLLEKLNKEAEAKREDQQHQEINHLEEHIKEAEITHSDIAKIGDELWHDIKEGVEDLLARISDLLKHH